MNGGTQSKCVENTTTGGSSVATTLKRPSLTGCSMTSYPSPRSVDGEERAGLAFASGRRIDVDELAREPELR